MKQTIIASIVFASFSSASAFALDLTNEKYQQDQYALQAGISGAQESARQADSKAYNAQQAANHAEQSANEARSRAESANTRLNGVESDVLTLQENTTSLQDKVTDNKKSIAAHKEGIENNATSIVKSQKESYDYTANQVAAEATARVNGDRQTLQSANAYTNQRFAQLDKRIGQVRDEANAGTASALAASQIPQVDTNGKFSLGAGVGGYKDESALALGASARLTDRTVTKFAVTTDSQNNFGFGAGAAVSW